MYTRPCLICGEPMEGEYDKRVIYCSPACSETARKQLQKTWRLSHKPLLIKSLSCKHCNKKIKGLIYRGRRKYHPECAVIINEANIKKNNLLHRQRRKTLKSLITNQKRNTCNSWGRNKDISYNDFTLEKKEADNGNWFKMSSMPTMAQFESADRICAEIEALCA